MDLKTFHIKNKDWEEFKKVCKQHDLTASAGLRVATERFLLDPEGKLMRRGAIAKQNDNIQGWLEDQITDMKENLLDSIDNVIETKLSTNKTLIDLRQAAEAGKLEVV